MKAKAKAEAKMKAEAKVREKPVAEAKIVALKMLWHSKESYKQPTCMIDTCSEDADRE